MSLVCFQPNDAPVEGAGNSRGAYVTQATSCWHYDHAGSSWESSPGYPTPQQGGKDTQHCFDSHPLISWAGSGMKVPGLQLVDQPEKTQALYQPSYTLSPVAKLVTLAGNPLLRVHPATEISSGGWCKTLAFFHVKTQEWEMLPSTTAWAEICHNRTVSGPS